MKVGDKFPVIIAGQKVADAEIVEAADGTVTVVTPRTTTVFATRTEIAPEVVNVDGSGTGVIIEDAERAVPEAPVAPVAPVEELGATQIDSGTVEAPPAESSQPSDTVAADTADANSGGSNEQTESE